MKNTQKGFIVPLLIAIIAVMAIGGGFYVYQQNKDQVPEQTGQLSTDQQTVAGQTTTSTETTPSVTTTSSVDKPVQKIKLSFQEIPLSKTDTFDSMGAPYGDRLLQMAWTSNSTLKVILAVGITCGDKISGGNYSIKDDKITLTYSSSGNSLANCNDNHKLQYTLENLVKKDYKIYTPYPGVTKPLSLFVPKVSGTVETATGGFMASPTIGPAPLQVTFTTTGKNNAFTTFKFGDGSMFSVGTPSSLNNFSCTAAASNSICRGTHTYSQPETYAATLYDAQGNKLDDINVIVTQPTLVSVNTWAFITADKTVNPFGDNYFIVQTKDPSTGKSNGINMKIVYDNNIVLVDRLGDTNGSNDKIGDFNGWLNNLKSCYVNNWQCPGPNVFQVVGHYTESSTIKADKIIHTIQ